MPEAVKAFLDVHQIQYTLHEHPAVFTVAEADARANTVPGYHCKNLFLREKNTGKFYLVSLGAHKRLDFKVLKELTGSRDFRFCKPDELQEKLGLTPGSVSPLGLINDTHHEVTFLIDEEMWLAPSVSIHPNVNTASLEIIQASFHTLITAFGNPYRRVTFT